MTELSPAAQAVLDALFMEELNGPQQLMARAHAAAALRAVVATCAYDDFSGHWIISPDDLERISAELESGQ